MSAVLAARERLKQAQDSAKAAIDQARAEFGLSIKRARERDRISQDAISRRLGLTREQVRRYERYYEDWIEKHGDLPAASN